MLKKGILVGLLTVLYSSASMADALPKISCELFWDRRDANGITIASKFPISVLASDESEDKRLKPQVEGFALDASLRKAGIGGGAPWRGAYDFTLQISKGSVVSVTPRVIGRGETGTRISTILIVGDERAAVNCDLQ